MSLLSRSLGCIVYEMGTRRALFQGQEIPSMLDVVVGVLGWPNQEALDMVAITTDHRIP